MNDQAPERRAALPGRAHRGEGDGALGQIEIGAGRDDHRIVAAQLQQTPAEASGDPRAGWQFRSPGHGGIDWPGLVRVLNEVGYDGPLAVDWHDPGMDREYGAADACRFVKAIDVPAPVRR